MPLEDKPRTVIEIKQRGHSACFLGIVLGVWLPAVLLFPSALPASGLKPKERMELIRELTAEYANLKVPLPRGKKGLLLSADGKVDQQSLKHEITQFGTASAPNTMVQITGLEIQEKQIVFEINGGGKSKAKWYDHIEAGNGDYTQPINPQGVPMSTGSSISLIFPKKIEELSVADAKKYLGPVLDFNPSNPIQAAVRPIPTKYLAAVSAKRAEVGMDSDLVIAAMGPPPRKVRETKDGIEYEDWIYGTPPMRVTFVTFADDQVVNVQEYEGGIGGSVEQASEPSER